MTAERPIATALENRLMSHGLYVLEFEWTGDATAAETATTDGAEADDGDAPATTADESGVVHPDDGDGIALEYETVAEAPTVTSDEVSAVVRTLLSIAEERDWTPGRLEATSRTTAGERRGRWHVERNWFEGLGAELSEVEFSRRVLETVRSPSHERQVD